MAVWNYQKILHNICIMVKNGYLTYLYNNWTKLGCDLPPIWKSCVPRHVCSYISPKFHKWQKALIVSRISKWYAKSYSIWRGTAKWKWNVSSKSLEWVISPQNFLSLPHLVTLFFFLTFVITILNHLHLHNSKFRNPDPYMVHELSTKVLSWEAKGGNAK